MRSWLLFLLLAACGDNSNDRGEEDVRDGARLTIDWFEFQDGTRQWQPEVGLSRDNAGYFNPEMFFDGELDMPCSADLWHDSVTRCTPRAERVPLFADAACTVRVTPNPEQLKFVADTEHRCNVDMITQIYPVTGTMPSPPTLYYDLGSGNCAAYTFGTLGPTVGLIGEPMPVSRFATITTAVSQDAGRIHVRYHESDDGMRLPIGLQDDVLGPASLGVESAIPDPSGHAYYANATCSERVVAVDAGCPVPVSVGFANSYSLVGEHIAPPAQLYSALGGSECPALPDGFEQGDFYRVQSDVVPLVEMAPTTDKEPARRIQLQHAFIGGRPVRTRTLVDIQLAGECRPYRFPDNVYRCLPTHFAYEATGWFADSACSVPADIAWDQHPEEHPKFSFRDRSDAGGTLTVHRLGEPSDDPVWMKTNDGCVPFTPGGVFRRLLDEVAWDSFASATLTTH